MSLDTVDLTEIRNIVEATNSRQSQEVIKPIQDEVQALRSDIKDIYDMLAGNNEIIDDDEYDELTLEEKILDINSRLVKAAKQAGVDLPR